MSLKVLLDGASRGLVPIKQGGAQGAPRASDSGLQARVSSKRLYLISYGGLHALHSVYIM